MFRTTKNKCSVIRDLTSKLFFIALNWIKEMAVHLADSRHHPIMQSAPEVLNKKWLLIRV
jgi:hypothetical protein